MFVHVLVSAAGKYREFHQLYSDRKFRAAGELLVSLLHSNIVPRRLASCACRHTIPALQFVHLLFPVAGSG